LATIRSTASPFLIKHPGNSTIFLKYRFVNGNLFMPSEWKNEKMECWNIGDKSGNKPF